MERFFLFVFLFILEFVYLCIAKRFHIVDIPNQRSSHKQNVLLGGGIVFLFAVWLFAMFGSSDYHIFILGMTLVSLVAFVDDIHPLSVFLRFFVQFLAMGLLLLEVEMFDDSKISYAFPTMLLGVCIINAYNFMDGINGITGAYSLVTLFTLWLLNRNMAYIDASLIELLMMSAIVFSFFNFRNKAICFSGDVGAVGMAFCIIFILLKLILYTNDVTNLIFVVVYGIDTLYTIFHRIKLHENILRPHRKHLFQLLANEGHLSHIQVTMIYVVLQFIISLGYIFLPLNKWAYLAGVVFFLSIIYLLVEKKLYPLHKKYLDELAGKKLSND